MNMMKTLPVLLLAGLALLPGSQAASFEDDSINAAAIDCERVAELFASDVDMSADFARFNACYTVSVAGGCTTTFAFAQTGDSLDLGTDQLSTTLQLYSNIYNNPVVPKNYVSYTLSFSLGTAGNGLDYTFDTTGNTLAFVNCAV